MPRPAYLYPPLTDGTILRRYKRFLADIELTTGELVTAHCPNTGAMTNCWAPGAPVQISHSDNPKRKLAWTLERVDMGAGWVGVNTARTNAVVLALIRQRHIPGLRQFDALGTEPRYGPPGFERSRFDLLLSRNSAPGCYVEVKNTSLIVDDQIQFPDAVTARGRKHLDLLLHAARHGNRAVILFAVNRPEGASFCPARSIDPAYADTFERVTQQGVEAIAVRLRHTPKGINFGGLVPIQS